jgi:tetratricopeptide (TPR) repeat protein
VRASALPLLASYASSASEPAMKAAIADPDPLVRAAAPRALPSTPPPRFVDAAAPLLGDPVRAVRIEAARALAGTDLLALTPEQQTALIKATAELVGAETVDADRPEAHLNLGLLELRRRQPAEAEGEYRTALRLDPNFVPALVNLADLDRARGMDEEGMELLKKAMAIEPDNADVRYALGLYLVRKLGIGSAGPGPRADARQRALCLCLCRGAEFEQCDRRGGGARRADASAASSRPQRADGARLDRTGHGEFCPGAPTC